MGYDDPGTVHPYSSRIGWAAHPDRVSFRRRRARLARASVGPWHSMKSFSVTTFIFQLSSRRPRTQPFLRYISLLILKLARLIRTLPEMSPSQPPQAHINEAATSQVQHSQPTSPAPMSMPLWSLLSHFWRGSAQIADLRSYRPSTSSSSNPRRSPQVARW